MEVKHQEFAKYNRIAFILTILSLLLFLSLYFFIVGKPINFLTPYIFGLALVLLIIGLFLYILTAYKANKANKHYNTKEFDIYKRPIEFAFAFVIIKILFTVIQAIYEVISK